MEEEGGTESSLLLPAARSLQAATAGNLCCKGKSEGSRAADAGGGGLKALLRPGALENDLGRRPRGLPENRGWWEKPRVKSLVSITEEAW